MSEWLHRIAARTRTVTLARCGAVLGPGEGTAWSSETTCEVCEDPETPWPMPGWDGEKDWFKANGGAR